MFMRWPFQVLVVLFIFFPGACHAQEAGQPRYAPGEVLVKFQENVSREAALSLHEQVGSKVIKRLKRINVDLVRIPEGWTVEKAIRVYQADPGVVYAEPNYTRSIQVKPREGGISYPNHPKK